MMLLTDSGEEECCQITKITNGCNKPFNVVYIEIHAKAISDIDLKFN